MAQRGTWDVVSALTGEQERSATTSCATSPRCSARRCIGAALPRLSRTALESGCLRSALAGEHLRHETVEPGSSRCAMELRERSEQSSVAAPEIEASSGRRRRHCDRDAASIGLDRVLEHLTNLPLRSTRSSASSNRSTFSSRLPEVWRLLARRPDAHRIFEKRYGVSYGWCIEREHVNVPDRRCSCEIERRFEWSVERLLHDRPKHALA